MEARRSARSPKHVAGLLFKTNNVTYALEKDSILTDAERCGHQFIRIHIGLTPEDLATIDIDGKNSFVSRRRDKWILSLGPRVGVIFYRPCDQIEDTVLMKDFDRPFGVCIRPQDSAGRRVQGRHGLAVAKGHKNTI